MLKQTAHQNTTQHRSYGVSIKTLKFLPRVAMQSAVYTTTVLSALSVSKAYSHRRDRTEI